MVRWKSNREARRVPSGYVAVEGGDGRDVQIHVFRNPVFGHIDCD